MPVIGPVRGSYVHVITPKADKSGVLKYSMSCLMPKKDKALLKQFDDLVQAAIINGIENGKFPKAKVPSLQLPLHDGSVDAKSGKRGPEYDGMMYFSASRQADRGQPGLLGPDRQPIVDTSEIYSGAWYYIHLNVYAYNNVNIGVACWLNHVMKFKDDERLDGQVSVDRAFEDIPIENVEDGGELM